MVRQKLITNYLKTLTPLPSSAQLISPFDPAESNQCLRLGVARVIDSSHSGSSEAALRKRLCVFRYFLNVLKLLCRKHCRCHFERAEGSAKTSRGEHRGTAYGPAVAGSPLWIGPAVGRLFFNRFLHFAPALSCESKPAARLAGKNGGFGRNDIGSFLQSIFKY
jgi:hypothetical protein